MKRTKPRRLVRLTGINFQSHEFTEVCFDDYFNAVCGPTDSGKSAFCDRLTKWIFYNKPSGSDFIRNGAGTAVGIAEFSDGTVITRTKGIAGPNSYDVLWPSGQQQHFESFGINPPEEVIRAHGMTPIMIGGSLVSLNLADQLDGAFMLQESPGARADAIGSIAKTEVIDLAIKDTNSDIRENKSDVSRLDLEIMKLEKQASQYNDLDNLFEILGKAEDLTKALQSQYDLYLKIDGIASNRSDKLEEQKRQNSIIERYKEFDGLMSRVVDLSNRIMKYKTVLTIYNKREMDNGRLTNAKTTMAKYAMCAVLSEQIEDLRQKLLKYMTIRNKSNSIFDARKKVKENESVLSEYENISTAGGLLDSLQTRIFGHKTVSGLQAKVSAAKQRYDSETKAAELAKDSINNDYETYQKAIVDFGKCPVCFGDIDEAGLTRIRQNLL